MAQMKSSTLLAVVAVIAIVVLFGPQLRDAVLPASVAPSDGPAVPSSVSDGITQRDKTSISAATIDMDDLDDEGQEVYVAGTATVVVNGAVLETITTSAAGSVASTAENFVVDSTTVSILGDATNYYAGSVENQKVQSLAAYKVSIAAEGTPTTGLEDEFGNAVTTVAIGTNGASDDLFIVAEDPGDDTRIDLCMVSADYDDDEVNVILDNTDGSADYSTVLDRLDTEEKYWTSSDSSSIMTVKGASGKTKIPFIVESATDVDPAAQNITLTLVDCEKNLQNGVIVSSAEDSSDADVGQSDIVLTLAIS